MPYRQIYLGDGEYTIARVPDEVVDEWREIRYRYPSSAPGYSRPPDVDTPEFRSWIKHQGEPGFQELLDTSTNVMDSETDFLIYSAGTELILRDAKIGGKVLVFYRHDRGYEYQMKISPIEGRMFNERVNTKTTTEWDEDAFVQLLELFHDFFLAPKDELDPDDPVIGTAYDFQKMQDETLIAEKELREYYASHN